MYSRIVAQSEGSAVGKAMCDLVGRLVKVQKNLLRCPVVSIESQDVVCCAATVSEASQNMNYLPIYPAFLKCPVGCVRVAIRPVSPTILHGERNGPLGGSAT